MEYCKRHLIFFDEANNIRRRHVQITFEAEQFVSNKSLLVRLTDEEDLYFLYSTRINDEDFNNIKSQQGLLVDFTGFGQKVIDLLELCLGEEQCTHPKYSLKFIRRPGEMLTGLFQIVEATNFKYLTHLSLNLRAGDDETLKAHLVGQLKTLKTESKAEKNSMESSLKDLSTRLASTQENYRLVKEQLEELKIKSRDRESEMKLEQAKELAATDKRLREVQDEFKTSLSLEQMNAATALEKIRNDLGEQLKLCKKEIVQLCETRDRNESTIERLNKSLSASGEINSGLQDEISVARSKLSTAEQTVQQQSSTLTRLENRINTLEQEVATKDQLISKTQDMLSSEQELKSRFQDELQQERRQLERTQSALEKESAEVKKANDIIKHLQADVKSHHTKSKLRGQVAAEQERLLSTKETELTEKHTELERLRNEVKDITATNSKLTEQLNQFTMELEEAQKTIKTNENIIGWLNRQISENQIGQVQQRLKSVGFPTPITNGVTVTTMGNTRTVSPLQNSTNPISNGRITTGSSVGSANIAPPWQSARPLSNINPSSNTIISRMTNVPCCTSQAILTTSIPTTKLGLNPTERGNMLGLASSQLPVGDGSVLGVMGLSGNLMRKTEVRPTPLLAPMTKSTPLQSDSGTGRRDGDVFPRTFHGASTHAASPSPPPSIQQASPQRFLVYPNPLSPIPPPPPSCQNRAQEIPSMLEPTPECVVMHPSHIRRHLPFRVRRLKTAPIGRFISNLSPQPTSQNWSPQTIIHVETMQHIPDSWLINCLYSRAFLSGSTARTYISQTYTILAFTGLVTDRLLSTHTHTHTHTISHSTCTFQSPL